MIRFEGNYRDFHSKFIVMFGFIFAFLMGLASPSHTNTNNNNTTGTNPTYSTFDTGGETGQNPPRKN
ncbi:hypothetical protein [Pedobacter antarcticus]|uniref:hypothetical protein n=1 Tax=Pedobacter antarcticus TaxID=34086 RepID=UPI00292CBB29|nr:hypothetical protein [Pedobacter antarcticus]